MTRRRKDGNPCGPKIIPGIQLERVLMETSGMPAWAEGVENVWLAWTHLDLVTNQINLRHTSQSEYRRVFV
jgi:hypothetical protein